MSSIVLEPGVKDMILDDCKDFLRSEDWLVIPFIPCGQRSYSLSCRYAERGQLSNSHARFCVSRRFRYSIPPRLLAPRRSRQVGRSQDISIGPPVKNFDSGKTSLIHSLAGELGLDIYVVSLSSKGYVFSHQVPPTPDLTNAPHTQHE